MQSFGRPQDISPDTITGATPSMSICPSTCRASRPRAGAVPPSPGRGAAPVGPAPSVDVDSWSRRKAAAQDAVGCTSTAGILIWAALREPETDAQRTSPHRCERRVLHGSLDPEIAAKSEDQIANELARGDDRASGIRRDGGSNEPELTPVERKVFRGQGAPSHHLPIHAQRLRHRAERLRRLACVNSTCSSRSV